MRDTNSQSFDLDRYVPYLLNRAGSLEAQTFTQLLAKHDISISAWRILASLHQRDDQRMGELSASTSIEVSTLSRSVAALERQGWVTRERSSEDARVVSVHMTEAGRKITDTIVPEAVAHEAARLDGFTEEEHQMLVTLLQRLYQNLSRHNDDVPSGDVSANI